MLNFRDSKFLLAVAVQRVERHHCAKFRHNWSNDF